MSENYTVFLIDNGGDLTCLRLVTQQGKNEAGLRAVHTAHYCVPLWLI